MLPEHSTLVNYEEFRPYTAPASGHRAGDVRVGRDVHVHAPSLQAPPLQEELLMPRGTVGGPLQGVDLLQMHEGGYDQFGSSVESEYQEIVEPPGQDKHIQFELDVHVNAGEFALGDADARAPSSSGSSRLPQVRRLSSLGFGGGQGDPLVVVKLPSVGIKLLWATGGVPVPVVGNVATPVDGNLVSLEVDAVQMSAPVEVGLSIHVFSVHISPNVFVFLRQLKHEMGAARRFAKMVEQEVTSLPSVGTPVVLQQDLALGEGGLESGSSHLQVAMEDEYDASYQVDEWVAQIRRLSDRNISASLQVIPQADSSGTGAGTGAGSGSGRGGSGWIGHRQ